MPGSARPKRPSTGRAISPVDRVSPSPPLQSVVKDEPLPLNLDPPAGSSAHSLRRSTRSSTSLALDLSSYAYTPPDGTGTPPRKRVKVEPSTPQTPEAKRPPLTPRSSSKKMPVLALDKPHKEPDRWREQYRLIEKMRRGIVAPVDDM